MNEETQDLIRLFYERDDRDEALFLLRKEEDKAPISPSIQREIEKIIGEKGSESASVGREHLLYGVVLLLWICALVFLFFQRKKSALMLSIVGLILFFALIFFSPIEGQLIRPTYLYKSPHLLSLKVDTLPIDGGELVEVLEVLLEGKWIKIRDSRGRIGYIPFEAILLFD